MANELWAKSARELAEIIRTKQASSREVLEAHLSRIDEVNATTNAVVEVLADAAQAAADVADRAVLSGAPLSTLHGVPFTVKTNIDVEGSATTEAVVALKNLIAPSDAPMVAKLRRAGAVAFARTNMPDFGLRITTESSLYGDTHNPWDYSRTVGGSSGGEAAAIATGMSPFGLGNDIGGSLRNPAYCCGIASIKPSFGRVASGNDSFPADPMLNSQLMLAHGPLARTVGDVREALRLVMGSDPRDPHAIDAPLEGPPRPKRVALVAEPIGGTTDSNVAEGVRLAGKALEAEGYEVDEVSPPALQDAFIAWAEFMMTSLAQLRPLLDPYMGDGGKRLLDLTALDFGSATAESHQSMHQMRFRVAKSFQQFFEQYPLIVGPTWTQPPFPLGWDIENADNAMAVMELFRMVLPANLMGLPAACVPTGIAGGLPTGAQIIGARFREDLCLDAAEAIERQLGVLTPITPKASNTGTV